MKEVDAVAGHVFLKLFQVKIGSDPETRSLINLRIGGFYIVCAFLAVIVKHFAESGFSDQVVEAGILGSNTVERAMNNKHYNNAVRMFKIIFEVFNKAKIDWFIEWILASSKYNYLVNSENFQNFLSKQDNESLKQFNAVIMPITNLIDEYGNALGSYKSGPSPAFWMSLISMIQIFLNFKKSIKTGN